MKIAYLLKYFPKLSESFVLNEIIGLMNLDNEILIFSLNYPEDSILHEDVNRYDLLERTFYYKRDRLFEEGKLQVLTFLLEGILYDMARGRFSKRDLIKNFKLAYFAAQMKTGGIKHIHSHFADMADIALKLATMLDVPYSITSHAYDIYMDPDFIKRKGTLEKAAALVTISEYNKAHFEKNGIKNDIEVIHCGIDLTGFDPGEDTASEKINILTTARLVEKKGIEYLIKAIPMVVSRVPRCHFTIIGSGPLEEELKALAEGVQEYISFKGSVSDLQLMEHYEKADIFALPCIIADNGDRDGIPVSIMEAMAMQLPVVSTSVSGIPELIADEENGILIPQKDTEKLSEALIMLAGNEKLRCDMGKRARERIEADFNLGKEVKSLNELFHRIRN